MYRLTALSALALSFGLLSLSVGQHAAQAAVHARRSPQSAQRLQGRTALLRPQGDAGFVGQPVRRSEGPPHRLRPIWRLYRMTPPALGGTSAGTKVEKLDHPPRRSPRTALGL